MYTSRKYFLVLTMNGLRYYKLMIPELTVNIGKGEKSKLVHNPFINCPYRSFQIYSEDGQWLFRDIVHKEFQGNVFKFGALHHKIKLWGNHNLVIFSMIDDLINKNKSYSFLSTEL